MSSIDIGLPMMIAILVFWGLLAFIAIMTTVMGKTHLNDTLKKIRQRLSDYRHERHSH